MPDALSSRDLGAYSAAFAQALVEAMRCLDVRLTMENLANALEERQRGETNPVLQDLLRRASEAVMARETHV